MRAGGKSATGRELKNAELDAASQALREAQRELIEKERRAAIEEFSGTVAHAIRNPLAGIRAAAQLALFQLEGHPAETTLSDAISEADRLDARIDALLDFSRPVDPDLKVVALGDVAHRAARDTSSKATEHNVKLVVEESEALPKLLLDPALLERATAELISNAIDASPSGAEVVITTGRDQEDEGPVVWIDVRDSGPGIATDQSERLFGLFYTTKPRGTGFGLVAVRKIAEGHGGRVFAYPPEGGGAGFRMVIPLQGREVASP